MSWSNMLVKILPKLVIESSLHSGRLDVRLLKFLLYSLISENVEFSFHFHVFHYYWETVL